MSNVFKDARGRDWELSLTYGDVSRVNKRLGVNLTKMADRQVSEEEMQRMSVADLPPFMRLQADPLQLVDVLYVLIEPQATKASVTDEDFGSALTPEVFKKASDIFWRLYEDFFLQSGEPLKAKMINGLRKLSGAVDQHAGEIDRRMEEAVDRISQEISIS